ncbi:unnamed protein product [Didymodactylos carnosus]|uniref:Uncharacterized protein n=1 Tax=Didymodactylos carnosus TaxID=1234261 RepID=A0A815M743_9BILA|nr:unnamed protein product [Didymodactylos carnosus]CAF1415386.1 unnamed protein product [Didymodactylos carnosus]CAF3712058.1 unnamed protein product [Didymodactylos carnosus]CAF4301616.1 unnamed protein product [Didymodactylos carnosus]
MSTVRNRPVDSRHSITMGQTLCNPEQVINRLHCIDSKYAIGAQQDPEECYDQYKEILQVMEDWFNWPSLMDSALDLNSLSKDNVEKQLYYRNFGRTISFTCSLS